MSASYLKSFAQRALRKTAQASKNEVLPTTAKAPVDRSAVAGRPGIAPEKPGALRQARQPQMRQTWGSC